MPNQRGLVTGVILALSAGGLVLLVHSAAGEDPNAHAAPAPSRRHRRGPDAERSPGGAAGTAEDRPRPVRHLRPEQGDALLGGAGQPAGAGRMTRVRLLPRSPRRDEAGDDLRGNLQGRRGRQAEGHGDRSGSCWRAATTSSPSSTRRPRCRGASRSSVGPTARLPQGMDWATLAAMSPAEIRRKDALPVQGAAASGAGGRAGRPGLSPDADQDVSPPGALRRRVRPPRSLPARVPAGDVSPEPARAGRRLPRRGRLDQQLLPPVQGHPDARAARRPAPAADAVPPGGVQSDRRPQDAPSPAWA